MDIHPITDKEWDARLEHSIYRTPFHEVGLMRCFINILGGELKLFLATNIEKSWLVPVFTGEPWAESSSGFTTSAVGYGGPLPLQAVNTIQEGRHDIFQILRALENTIRRKFLKGVLPPIQGWEYKEDDNFTETMLVDLKPSLDEVFQEVLSGSARTAIRKAAKLGLLAQKVNNDEDIAVAHNLISSTQKSVGASYITPLSLVKEILTSVNAELHIVSIDQKMISSGVLIIGKTHNFHWLHGWNRDCAHMCANQLLIWSMMQSCISRESLVFNMGASYTAAQKKAKEKWGARETNILRICGPIKEIFT